MKITWEPDILNLLNLKGAMFAKIDRPSKIRQHNRYDILDERMTTVAIISQDEETKMYSTAFIPAIRQYFDIPIKPLKTEKGARKRIRKYVELWAIAGYPTGDRR